VTRIEKIEAAVAELRQEIAEMRAELKEATRILLLVHNLTHETVERARVAKRDEELPPMAGGAS
jgi:molybdopterin converting factor small subunit